MFKFIIVVGLFCTTSLSIRCQDPTGLTLNFTALIVADIDTSIAWYHDILNFEVINQSSLPQRRIRQANLYDGQTYLELIELGNSIAPDSILTDELKGNRIQGIFKIGFTVSSFDDWVHRFQDMHVHMQENIVTDPNTNKRMIIIYDPDGNRLQFFEE